MAFLCPQPLEATRSATVNKPAKDVLPFFAHVDTFAGAWVSSGEASKAANVQAKFDKPGSDGTKYGKGAVWRVTVAKRSELRKAKNGGPHEDVPGSTINWIYEIKKVDEMEVVFEFKKENPPANCCSSRPSRYPSTYSFSFQPGSGSTTEIKGTVNTTKPSCLQTMPYCCMLPIWWPCLIVCCLGCCCCGDSKKDPGVGKVMEDGLARMKLECEAPPEESMADGSPSSSGGANENQDYASEQSETETPAGSAAKKTQQSTNNQATEMTYVPMAIPVAMPVVTPVAMPVVSPTSPVQAMSPAYSAASAPPSNPEPTAPPPDTSPPPSAVPTSQTVIAPATSTSSTTDWSTSNYDFNKYDNWGSNTTTSADSTSTADTAYTAPTYY